MLKEIFTWSKQERTGVIVLSSVLLLMISGDVFFDRIFPEKGEAIHPDTLLHYQELLNELENDLAPNSKKTELRKSYTKNETKPIPIKPSFFDPNDLDLQDWQDLGFSEKQAISIIRYKKQIGRFKTKEQVASSYVISAEKYDEIGPFISIKAVDHDEPSKAIYDDKRAAPKKESISERVYIQLNSADSIDLLKLKGIGPFYASKIIEYREELGAYVKEEQLLEIWKFDSLKLANIKDNIWIDTSDVRKLHINSDSLSILKSHPYLDWNHSKAIVNYREQHGVYRTKSDLLKIVIFSDSLLNKLYPYISLD
jgi:DNA uptake protein ComE-like DNA-binding protein